MSEQDRIHESPRESRQATKTPTSMRYVLAIGTIGVAVAFVIVYFAVIG